MTKVPSGWTLDVQGRQVRPNTDPLPQRPMHRYVVTVNDFSVQIIAPDSIAALTTREKQLATSNGPRFKHETEPSVTHAETCSCGEDR